MGTERYLSDADLAALSGTVGSAGEPYPTQNENPHGISDYKHIDHFGRLAIPLSALQVFGDGTLAFGVRAGQFMDGDTVVSYAGASDQSLTNNQTNYIYLTVAGVLTVNTSGFPTPSTTNHLPLAEILTASGTFAVTDITDRRPRSIFQLVRGRPESEKTWTFDSPQGASGTFYSGGFYNFASSDDNFNPAVTHGTANSAYGAHVFLVSAAGASGGTDTVIRVSGTSITDAGVRNAADTEDLTLDDAGAADLYQETTKKWIGQVSLELQSGPDLLCNYGFAKYWDNNNNNYTIVGFEAVFLAGASDGGVNIELCHHKATGWTYNAASTPTPPSPLAAMQTDYNTEFETIDGEQGSWKRDNLGQDVEGGDGEGHIIRVTTTANKAFERATFMIRIRPRT